MSAITAGRPAVLAIDRWPSQEVLPCGAKLMCFECPGFRAGVKNRLVFLMTATSLLFAPILSNAQECSHVAGTDWVVQASNGQTAVMTLDQTGSTITGSASPSDCTPNWPVSQGTFNQTNGEFSFTLSNPLGPFDFQFGCAPWVKLKGDVSEPGCDKVVGMDLTNPMSTISANMQKTCDVPLGEYTVSFGQSPDPGWSTVGVFGVGLTGSGNPYKGRSWVQERDLSYPAYDQCHPSGGTSVGGTTWYQWVQLEAHGQTAVLNTVGQIEYSDQVGRSEAEVLAIRGNGMTLPCGNQFGVKYSLTCSVPITQWQEYHDLTMGTGVSQSHVGFTRNSSHSFQWP